MKSRLASLDLLRAFAICLVLLCHWGQSLGWMQFGVAGGVANCLFFLLSGFALGYSWRQSGYGHLGLRFIRNRFLKLYIPFALFLFPYMLVLIVDGDISCGEVILNALMLSWLSKLVGAGHLWFVTGIFIFYSVLLVFSFAISFKAFRPGVLIVALLIACGMLQAAISSLHVHQAYYVMLLVSAITAFYLGARFDSIMAKLRKYKFSGALLFVLVIAVILSFSPRMDVMGNVLYYWLCMAIAVSLLGITFIFDVCNGPIVSSLSAISYELYLVHYPFCSNSPLYLRRVFHNDVLYTIAYIGISVSFAFLLKTAANRIMMFMGKK